MKSSTLSSVKSSSKESKFPFKTKIPDHILKFRDSKFRDHSFWRILIVDDSATCRKINHHNLAKMGHVIVEADCGIVATQMVKNALTTEAFGANRCSFDVVIMNNVMKGMDGPHTVFQMRELGFDGIILGLMCNPRQKDLDRFIENGADNVLAKPLTIDDFSIALSGKILKKL